jgi:hypothetical protein
MERQFTWNDEKKLNIIKTTLKKLEVLKMSKSAVPNIYKIKDVDNIFSLRALLFSSLLG